MNNISLKMMNRRSQNGVATVLLVILVGITIMLATTTVVLVGSARKDVSSASHAQTNAQVMAWAGVSAFNDFLSAKANDDMQLVQALHGTDILLKKSPQEIIAKNIKIEGCSDFNDLCSISADITASNFSAASAAVINAIYNLSFNRKVDTDKGISLTGNTIFTGNTTISTEALFSNVTLNIDGNLKLNLGFKTENISVLDINSTGDVYIDCGVRNCGESIINVTSKGSVTLVNGKYFGDINSLDKVTLRIGAHAQDVKSLEGVTLESGSTARNIYTKGNILFTGGSSADSLYATGHIKLYTSHVRAGNVESENYIVISSTNVRGDVKANAYISLDTNSKVSGSLYARGDYKGPGSSVVSHSASTVEGSVYANGDLYLWGLGSIRGNAYLTGKVGGISGYVLKGKKNVSQGYPVVANIVEEFDKNEFITSVYERISFVTRVDVRAYKDEANYIFTKSSKFDHVYLNKLINKASGDSYIYKDGAQYAVDTDGNEKFLSSNGFALGDYKINKKVYTGAVCLAVDDKNFCTDEIVGYLPRISVGRTLGVKDDYGYSSTLERWRVRSIKNSSEIESAVLAPGILYFEGTLEFAGSANVQADSHSNAFINTFLAEGEIWDIAFSPRIYSPFNVMRESEDYVSLVCDRQLRDISGHLVDAVNMIPGTVSNTYLMPSNLCESSTDFNRNMNKDSKGKVQQIIIDDTSVDKLELGYVALMANEDIHIGACGQVYGDVLSRKEINISKACGLTDNRNAVNGYLVTGGVGRTVRNDFMSGTNIVIPGDVILKDGDLPGHEQSGESSAVVRLKWAKHL